MSILDGLSQYCIDQDGYIRWTVSVLNSIVYHVLGHSMLMDCERKRYYIVLLGGLK